MSSTENEKNIVVAEESEIYTILDSNDEQQMLLDASETTGQALIYEISKYDEKTHTWTKVKEPSYLGINWLVIHMSQNMKQGLKITKDSLKISVNRFFDPDTNQDRDFVTAQINIYNEVTGLETPGLAEQPLLMKVYERDAAKNKIWNNDKKEYKYHWKYDEFAQRKALSKALRNAWKLQFPVDVLKKLVKIAESKGLVTKISNPTQTTADQSTSTTVSTASDKACMCRREAMKMAADNIHCANCGGKFTEAQRKMIETVATA